MSDIESHAKQGTHPAFWGWMLLVVLVVGLDRLSKAAATAYLPFGEPVPVLPSFNLTLWHNTGAAFSILSDASGWQRWLFSALAGVVSVMIVVWLRGIAGKQRLLACALALIAGGAIGNLWDRLTLGYVVDFIQLYYAQFSWPTFNVADSAISVGACLLILDVLLARERPESGKQAAIVRK